MENSAFTPYGIPKLDATNYSEWVVMMKIFLKARKLWFLLEKEHVIPVLTDKSTDEDKKKWEEYQEMKNNAMMALHLSVSRPLFQKIASCDSPGEIWQKLKEQFAGDEQMQKMLVRTKLAAKFEAKLCSLEAEEAIKKSLNITEKRTFLQFINSLQALWQTLS